MDNELHVVLGATGGIGSAVVAAATEAGLAVRGVSRSGGVRKGPGGDARAADVSTPEGARHAVEGASVVYHCAQPPYAQWSQHFPPMTAAELADVDIEVSLLTPPEPFPYADFDDLAARLQPGVHGVLLSHRGRRGTFLPQVWESLPDPRQFLSQLCLKAHLSTNIWDDHPSIDVYTVEKYHETQGT